MNLRRRELLAMGVPAAGAAMLPAVAKAAAPTPASTETADTPALPWPQRRQQIERKWLDLLGDFPTEVPDLKPQMKEVAYENGITRYHVSFQTQPDDPADRVTGWLLVPDAAKTKPTAAIICIHSTTWGSGKSAVIGLSGRRPIDPPRDPEIGAAYGLDLAKHGFITLNIDLLTDGERIKPDERVMDTRGFYQQYPEWSIVGKNTWDTMRSVDFLQTLDFVDHAHIGVIGWSLGGHSALFAGAFDQRITATVSNGGVLDWHRTVDAWSRNPSSWKPWKKGIDAPTSSKKLEERFGFKTNSGPYIYIKKFRPYIENQDLPIPVDFDELMMMVAPRPLMIVSSEHEFARHKIMPKLYNTMKVYLDWGNAQEVLEARKQRLGIEATYDYYQTQHKQSPSKVDGIVEKLGPADGLSWFSFPGGHGLPGVARRATFAWYDRWLGRTTI